MSTTISTTNSTNAATSIFDKPTTSTPANDTLTDKSTFLKLLVAQLQNQNPLSPADGVQFVSQLAQFTNLEQSLEMNSSLKTIRDFLTTAPAPAKSTSTTTTSN